MGTTESREYTNPSHQRARANPRRSSPYQPAVDGGVLGPSTRNMKERKSSLIYKSMLLELFDNTSSWEHVLPYPRRIAMIESIRRVNDNGSPQKICQCLTEIVMEGLLTCDSLSPEDKNLIVMDGLMEQRWDRVFAKYRPGNKNGTEKMSLDKFYSYRLMILVLLKNSHKMQQLPEESRQRLKQMVLQTNKQVQLDKLLQQILERTCGVDIQKRITNDMVECRYYRLVWPDRLDCERNNPRPSDDGEATVSSFGDDDRKLPAKPTTIAYGSVLLPDDLSHRQDCCPICLDPVQPPALELSCRHVFCSRCISNWIVQQQQNHNSGMGRIGSHEKLGGWHCPVCRQVHDAH